MPALRSRPHRRRDPITARAGKPAALALTPLDAIMLAALALFGAAACAVLVWMQGDAIEALRAELDARPPVAVVDYAPVAAAVAEGRAPEEIEPLFRAIKARSAALRDGGFLVLNRAAIDGAPEALVVRVDPPPPVAAPPLPVADAPPLWSPTPQAPARAPVGQEALTDAEARALVGAVTGGDWR